MTEVYQVCSNDDPMLTFDLSTKRSVLHFYALIWEKYWKVDFAKTVEGLCIIYGTLFNLEHENISMSRSLDDLCFKVPWIHFFKQQLLRRKKLYSNGFWSTKQDGHHAHIGHLCLWLIWLTLVPQRSATGPSWSFWTYSWKQISAYAISMKN